MIPRARARVTADLGVDSGSSEEEICVYFPSGISEILAHIPQSDLVHTIYVTSLSMKAAVTIPGLWRSVSFIKKNKGDWETIVKRLMGSLAHVEELEIPAALPWVLEGCAEAPEGV